jgi:hypothetical protein
MVKNFSFFNPFRGLIETKVSPHARALRTSFSEKLMDAFFVLAGSSNLLRVFIRSFVKHHRVREHLGLLDFVTLGISHLLDLLALLVAVRWKSPLPFKFGVLFLIGVIAVPLAIVRGLVAALIVFNPLSLFIIGGIHFVSQYIAGGAELNEKTRQFLLTKDENHVENQNIAPGENCPDTFSIRREDLSFVYPLGAILTGEDGERMGAPNLVKQGGQAVGLQVESTSFVFYAPLFSHNKVASEEIEKTRAALKLNLDGVTENMERYVANHEAGSNKTKTENYEDCRQVLNSIDNPQVIPREVTI